MDSSGVQTPNKSEYDVTIDFHRVDSNAISREGPLSFFTIINLDPFVKSVLNAMKDNKKLPTKIRDEMNKEKRNVTSIPSSITSKHQLYDTIKPFISDTDLVWSLVDNFFESEVFNSCSFIDKEKFIHNLRDYIGPARGYPAVSNVLNSPFDLIFIGTLLVILRISSFSVYNCGYETNFTPLPVDVIDLAKLCYKEVKDAYQFHKISLLEFILILDFYRLNSPEEIDYLESHEAMSTYILAYKIAIGLGLHLESASDHFKKLWFHIVELDTDQFLRDGSCSFFIDESRYSTKLPQFPNDSSFYIRERYRVRELIKPLCSAITNVHIKPSISELENMIKKLEIFLNTENMESIFMLKDKSQRAVKFLNFLDISCLVYMVLYHIFLHYTSIDAGLTIETMKRLLNISNPVLQTTHFFDSTKEHFYNLQEQFGTNYTIIPKLLNSLHKFLQLQISLIGRTNYIIPGQATSSMDSTLKEILEIKRIAYQNSKTIIANFGRISNNYFYAKRMNKIQTILFVNVFGTSYDSPVSSTYLKALEQDYKVVDSKIINVIVELNRTAHEQRNIDDNDLLDIVLDQESIEQLEQMLSNQSFLY